MFSIAPFDRTALESGVHRYAAAATQQNESQNERSICLRLRLSRCGGQRIVGQNGGAPGVAAQFDMHLDRDDMVVLLAIDDRGLLPGLVRQVRTVPSGSGRLPQGSHYRSENTTGLKAALCCGVAPQLRPERQMATSGFLLAEGNLAQI